MPFQKGNKEYLKKKPMTEEQRELASKRNSGENNPCFNRIRPQSERDAISKTLTGRFRPQEVVAKIVASNTGKKRTEKQNKANSERLLLYYALHPEAKELAKEKAIKQWQDPIKRANCTAANKIAANKESKKEKIRKIVKSLWQNENYAKMMSDSHKGNIPWNKDVPMKEESKAKLVETNSKLETKARRSAGQNRTEVKEKHIENTTKCWRDPEYVKKQRIARDLKPNKTESYIIYLLNLLFPEEWRYTGDFSFWINHKNPDFVNCNGQKKCIEFNGDYYHQNDIPGEREKIFAEFGYDTLILSDIDMINEEKLKMKLIEFHNRLNPYSVHGEI